MDGVRPIGPAEPETSAQLSAAALRGRGKTEKVRIRIVNALTAIQTEIIANSGVYPFKNGRLTKAEVARRAGVDETSLYTKGLKSTGEQVSELVEWYKNSGSTGTAQPVSKRKGLEQRRLEWQMQYYALLQSHQLTEAQLQQTTADLDDEREKVRLLTDELRLERSKAKKGVSKRSAQSKVVLRSVK